MKSNSGKEYSNRYYRNRLLILFGVVIAALLLAFIYSQFKQSLFDKALYKEINTSFLESYESFSSNDDFRSYITNWADSKNIEYEVDEAGNIIFHNNATKAKANEPPVVVCASYNNKAALIGADITTICQYIAACGFKSTEYSVILFNNENSEFTGYKNISEEYFPDKAKVIYLDYGRKTHASRSSFNENRASYVIAKEMQPSTCDTCVHVSIKGVTTDEITSRISGQVNPITAFGTVLARMESKASHYELANIKVGNQGNMFPSSIEYDILVNSYSVESLCDYLDDRIDSLTDKYKENFPELEYTYEVIDDPAKLPAECYSEDVCKSINNIIYTFDNGTYRFEKDDEIPADFEVDEVYGVNSIEELIEEDDKITINICTQALSDAYLDKIVSENKIISEFANCEYVNVDRVPCFSSSSEGLYNELNFTYLKVNDVSSQSIIIKDKEDHYFTPCSYLAEINPNMELIHLSVNEKSPKLITNTLICYIDSVGNFLSF